VRGPDYSLRIYPKHPHTDAYKIGGAYEPYAIVATNKRFSDAELAAEYQYARFTQNEELLTIRRFATLPHFDE
jgi:hypothetical protein